MKNINVTLLHRPESIIGEEPNRYETRVDIESNFQQRIHWYNHPLIT